MSSQFLLCLESDLRICNILALCNKLKLVAVIGFKVVPLLHAVMRHHRKEMAHYFLLFSSSGRNNQSWLITTRHVTDSSCSSCASVRHRCH